MRPGDVRRAGSGSERGKAAPSNFFSPDPARPAPAFTIDPRNRLKKQQIGPLALLIHNDVVVKFQLRQRNL